MDGAPAWVTWVLCVTALCWNLQLRSELATVKLELELENSKARHNHDVSLLQVQNELRTLVSDRRGLTEEGSQKGIRTPEADADGALLADLHTKQLEMADALQEQREHVRRLNDEFERLASQFSAPSGRQEQTSRSLSEKDDPLPVIDIEIDNAEIRIGEGSSSCSLTHSRNSLTLDGEFVVEPSAHLLGRSNATVTLAAGSKNDSVSLSHPAPHELHVQAKSIILGDRKHKFNFTRPPAAIPLKSYVPDSRTIVSNSAPGRIFNTDCHWSNSQAWYSATDLTSAGLTKGSKISSIALRVGTVPGRDLRSFAVRHGLVNEGSSPFGSFATTTLAHGPVDVTLGSISADSWFEMEIDPRVTWDGVSTLVIEFREGEHGVPQNVAPASNGSVETVNAGKSMYYATKATNATSTDHRIRITSQEFVFEATNRSSFPNSPRNVTEIYVGDSVTWANEHTGVVHNVMNSDGRELFNSNYLEPGHTFTHTFTYAGLYEYKCRFHEDSFDMFAKVLVHPRLVTTSDAPLLQIQMSSPGAPTSIVGQQGTVGQVGGDLLLDAGLGGGGSDLPGIVQLGSRSSAVRIGSTLQLNTAQTTKPICSQKNRGAFFLRSESGRRPDSLWLCTNAGAGLHRWFAIGMLGCPAGYYADTHSAEDSGMKCIKCKQGRFTDKESVVSCALCPAGYYHASRGQTSDTVSCITCPAGKYTNHTHSFDHEQRAWIAHYGIPDHAAVQCLTCPAGQYTNVAGSGTCIDPSCSIGKYVRASSAGCISCPGGYYTNLYDSDQMRKRDIRSYGAFGSCKKCPSGYYDPDANSPTKLDGACTMCPAGYYQGYHGYSSCSYTGCGSPSGRYHRTDRGCNYYSCPSGYFQDQYTQTDCKRCPGGYYTSSSGYSRCYQCGSSSSASAGKYRRPESSSCTVNDCPVGYFTAVPSQNSCLGCRVGRYASSARSTSCSRCPIGYYQSNQMQRSCVACPAGKHSFSFASGSCD